MGDWNPAQYLKFKKERTQPSIDLISKIKLENPKSIIDIGCGPGNSTQVLYQRWPTAKIVGLDHSEEMIKKAQKDFPNQKWILADVSRFETREKYDLIFSNATLQWIPNHDFLLPHLFNLINDQGALAVQVPANNESPLHQALLSTAHDKKWYCFTEGCEKLLNYRTPPYYYNLLSPIASHFDLWETTYYHVLPSQGELIEWYRSTGMRPFLERLPDDETKKQFEKDVLEGCRNDYKPQRDGRILYPFKRIFFVAYK
jgi:trans-aconitate 2-methyltransferase